MVAISSSGSGKGPGRVTGRGYSTDSQLAPGRVEPAAPQAKLAPLSAQRFGLQVTISRDTYEKMRYAQALLGHQPRAAELAAMLDRAFDLLLRRGLRRSSCPHLSSPSST